MCLELSWKIWIILILWFGLVQIFDHKTYIWKRFFWFSVINVSILYFLGKMEKTAVLKSIVNNNLLKDNRNKRNLEIFEVQDESKIIYIPSTLNTEKELATTSNQIFDRFLPLLHRAEICQKFGWLFGRFDDTKISFWD